MALNFCTTHQKCKDFFPWQIEGEAVSDSDAVHAKSTSSCSVAGLVFGLQLLQCLLKRSAFLSLIHLVRCLFCGCCYFLYFGLEFINRVCLFMLPWARLLCQCFTAKVTVLLQAVVVTLHSHFMKCVDVLYITPERVNIIDQLFFLICPSTS